jgi:hypothetical protein
MNYLEDDILLKPSEILKKNKEDKKKIKDKNKEIEEKLKTEREYGNKFQNILIKQKKIKNTLLHIENKKIHDILNKIFNKHIIELYKFIAKKKEWYNNVRAFIEFHNITDFSIYSVKLNEEEVNVIKQQGFDLFVSKKCANINEEEFDGPNDLSIEEWEDLDEIILYYYCKYLS